MHIFLTYFILSLGTLPQGKTYYVSLSISNQSPDDITVSFLEDGELKERNISRSSVGSIMIAISSNVPPPHVEFRAFIKGTGTSVMLNGTESLNVMPTENQVPIPVLVGNGRLSKSLLINRK